MKLLIILFVVVICGLIVVWTQREPNKAKGKRQSKITLGKALTLGNLKTEAEKEFKRLSIKERNGQILICEIDHRGEFNELVFVRLNTSSPKRVENKGRFLVASYPYIPSGAEMRKDFGSILNKY